MLNLSIAMIKEFMVALFIAFFLTSGASAATSGVELLTPTDGQVLQGNVEVKGSIPSEGFVSATLAYAYADSDSETWFLISTISQPVNNDVLAIWDTSTISDGDYQLKLTVTRQNGQVQDVIVKKLLVRNYTPVESTAEIIVTQVENISEVSATVPPPLIHQATAYPVNRAALNTDSVNVRLKQGATLGIVCLLALGVYSFFRGWLRRR